MYNPYWRQPLSKKSQSVLLQRLMQINSDTYLITIDLSQSWDWKSNISEVALEKKASPQTRARPPIVSRGALYHGRYDDDTIYLWGGTTSWQNTSFPGFQNPLPSRYALWSYNDKDDLWRQFDTGSSVQNRPSSGSYAEALDLNLAFYFNGQLDSGNQKETQTLGDKPKIFIKGMIVLDLASQTARNLSTDAVGGDHPRSRGRMEYISNVGGMGILVQIGGNRKFVGDMSDQGVGDLVRFLLSTNLAGS